MQLIRPHALKSCGICVKYCHIWVVGGIVHAVTIRKAELFQYILPADAH